MNSPANLPNLPHDPHSYQLAHYSHTLLRLSGMPTHSDDPEHELWRRLDHALTQLEARLTRGKDPVIKIGRRFNLKEGLSRSILAMSEHFGCTRSAIIRQWLRQCPPVESFPRGWVAEDRRLIEERERLIHEQLAHLEEVP